MKPTHLVNDTKRGKVSVFENEKELQKYLEVNFTESLKQMIKVTVNIMVKTEMEEFRRQIDERLQFNGTYGRNMRGTFGTVEGVPIPRFRQGLAGMELNSLSVFEAEEQKFMRLIEEMHMLGISQWKVKRIARLCLGTRMSTTKVGAIHKELADKEELQINAKPLLDEYEYLYLDGIWETTKGYGWDENKSVLLCALGVKTNGERKIVGFALCRAEDEKSWGAFVRSLKKRGLTGVNLKLIIADDNVAIHAAAENVFEEVPLQNCVAHKLRNVVTKTSFKNKTAVAEDAKAIFHQETRKEAFIKAKEVVKRWYIVEPKAMESLRFHLELCFTYFDFPQEDWKKIRTSNLLEREFREVRRRMKVFDNTFQSQESGNRYANSIFNYLNETYPHKSAFTH